MKSKKFLILFCAFACFFQSRAQQIMDPCFLSPQIGMFYNTPQVGQICDCSDPDKASDMLEWDGEKWLGILERTEVDLPPPPGCIKRAAWMGFQNWTRGGEGIALKLDRPIQELGLYSYSFTYARDGIGPDEPFGPLMYTNDMPSMTNAIFVGQLTPSFDWKTDTVGFIASRLQAGHSWLIVKALTTSGIVLAPCKIESTEITVTLPHEGTVCLGESVILQAPVNDYYQYQWNTGAQTPSISVDDNGTYEVEISLPGCFTPASGSIMVSFTDCTVNLEMPNFFSPNDDLYNPVFKPISHNYIERGWLQVYNRWGEKVFEGDLFTGWDGNVNKREVATGVYFWTIGYTDKNGLAHTQRGTLQLSR